MQRKGFDLLLRALGRCLLGAALLLAAGGPALAQADRESELRAAEAKLAAVLAAHAEASEEAVMAMFGLAGELNRLARYPEARDMYLRAAAAAEKGLGADHVLLGAVLNNLADNDDDMEQYAEARRHFTRTVEIFMAKLGGRNQFTLRAINSLANTFLKLDDFERAQKAYEFVVPRREELHGKDSILALRSKAGLARTLASRGRYAEANKLMQEVVTAHQRSRAADDDETLAAMLDNAATFSAMGDYEAALQLTQQVLAARLARYGAADLRTLRAKASLASHYSAMGRHAEALALHEEVLAGRRRVLGENDALTIAASAGVANTLAALGRYPEAEPLLRRVAAAHERRFGFDDVLTLGAWLDVGDVLGTMGRYAEAGPLQERIAKAANAKLGLNHPLTLNAINALSGSLFNVGRHEHAAELAQMVVEGRAATLGEQHRETLAARHNLALRLMRLKRLDEARSLVESALKTIEAAAPQHAAMADLPYYYRTLGEIHIEQGQRGLAEQALRRGLALVEQSMGPDSALAGNLCNFLARAIDDPRERIALHGRALSIGRAAAASEVSWRAADGLRAAHEAEGNAAAAIHYGKQAINTIQAVRRELATLGKGMQQGFLADKRPVYAATAELLIAQGRLAEGQQVLGLLKQEEYYDFVSRSDAQSDPARTQLALNRQEQAWVARYEAVSERLVEISKRKLVLDARARSGSITEEERAQRSGFEADLAAARSAFDAATREIAEESRRQAAAGQGQRLGAEVIDAVRAMRDDLKELGHGAVLVHYLIAGEKLWILLTTPEVQVARESKVAAADLNRRIDALRNALRTPRGDARAPAEALYRLLLAPIARDLEQAQARTLMLSLDGALRYVPFAALHDGQDWAVRKWRFALLTEAAKSRIKDNPRPDWTITALGLTRAVGGLPALPAVREELSGLVRSGLTPQGVMDGELMFDDAFTAAAVESALGDPNPVLHIASHFKFTPGTEADSYLLMGDGGRLSLQQIRQKDLRFRVDLLTLSACDTAVGDNARGQEVEGLGALAQKQGAKAVLATLWPVADGSTGLFMREMYRRRSEQRLTKAEAIRQVQIDFAAGRLGPGSGGAGGRAPAQTERGVRAQGAAPASPAGTATGWTHPFYWAPFILMGNWL